MVKIEKENIWDLVGSGYHSCLITTYSFDFYYFERSAMRVLRSKGISNISIFVDNNIFQGILGKVGSCSNSRVYALNPMPAKGCFHPKVYMFFGEKQGLLIVGSGNLTSSGHGKNDEVWGAFHFDINEKNNEQILSDAWSYFQTLSSNIKGFSVEKINWIKEYTPWLESLPIPNGFQTIDDYNEVAFLANDTKGNIYQKLTRNIPNDDVRELTVIAPYFDLKGKILEAFSIKFKNAKINVLLDDVNGILPLKLKNDVSDNMFFYHWKDCCERGADKETSKRLHAKIFHLILADNTEYCLIGSANASVAAFGNENYSAINDEVSLLFKSSNQDFLFDLGIKINPVNMKKLSDFKNGLEEDDVFGNEFSANNKYDIGAIDKEGNVLSVHLNAMLDSNAELALYNTWGELVSKAKLTIKNNHYSASILESTFDAIYGCIIDSDTSEIISNKQIIQDVIVLSKTNPDPQKRVLDVLFNGIEQGDEHLFSKLIDCISTDDFKTEKVTPSKKVSIQKETQERTESVDEKGEVLNYNEFKDVSYESKQNQYVLLNSTTSRVADFLSNLLRIKTKEEISSQEFDDEELDVDNEDNQGRDDKPESKVITKSAHNTEKKRIVNFLKRYDDYLNELVEELISKSNHNATNEDEISLTELSNFVVALYIAIYYTDRNRKYDVDGKTLHEKIITSYGFESNNLPAINANIIGKFLLLCTRGFKSYDSDFLNERLEKLKNEALYHCVFCIASAKWGKGELHYKENLLINTLHYLSNDAMNLLNDSNFISELNIRQNISSIDTKLIISDIKEQISHVLPNYIDFMMNLSRPISERRLVSSKELIEGTSIFTSRFGFCEVENKMNNGEGAYLTLSRPGFPWIDDKEEYLLQEKRLYKRNIEF